MALIKEVKMKKIYLLSLVAVMAIFSLGSVANFDDKYTATMSGSAEVPGPGDPDGSGTAEVTVDESQGKVCYELKISNIGAATVAHIHEAVSGQAGPPVVDLKAPGADGNVKDCVTGVDKEVIKRIKDNPTNFYANVHNEEFPDGQFEDSLPERNKES